MKHLSTIVLFLLSAPYLLGQDIKSEISRQFIEYSQLIIDKNFEMAMDYTIEDIFTIIPRQELKKVMESVFNTPSIEFKLHLPEIDNIDRLTVVDGTSYARLTTKSNIEMKFVGDAEGNSPASLDNNEREELFTAMLKQQFGADHVVRDKLSGFYTVTGTKIVIAKSYDNKSWKFAVVDNPGMKVLLGRFFPKELLE
jgi:hypothetical protein